MIVLSLVSSLNTEVLVKPHQPPVGSHSSCQNQKVNQKVNDIKTPAATETLCFQLIFNIVTFVHVAALTEWCNVKYIADLSVQPAQEKCLDKSSFCCRTTEKKTLWVYHICKAAEYLVNNIYCI